MSLIFSLFYVDASPLDVLEKFQGGFKGVSSKFQWCYKELFKKVSRKCKGDFKGVLECFKGLSRKFQWCLEEVLRKEG